MTARLKEWLDGGYKEVYAPDAEQMMLAALREVVELHRHVTGGMAEWCEECGSDVAWPCPTIRVIEKEVLR